MSRRRRAALLLGLALVLGGVAASDVARREAAIQRQLGPAIPVVVARRDLAAGTRLAGVHLALRRVPARYAPVGAAGSAGELVGLRVQAPVRAGAFLSGAQLDAGDGTAAEGAPVRPGERVAEVIASGSPELVQPGSRVDVLITRDSERGTPGRTVLALEDVEVLAAASAGEAAASAEQQGPRVTASLRVTVRQAVYLAAAQSFAREVRLLPRAARDRRRGDAGLSVGAGLR